MPNRLKLNYVPNYANTHEENIIANVFQCTFSNSFEPSLGNTDIINGSAAIYKQLR